MFSQKRPCFDFWNWKAVSAPPTSEWGHHLLSHIALQMIALESWNVFTIGWLSMTGQQRNSWCNVLCEGRRTNVVLRLGLLIVPWEMQKCCRSTHRLLLLCFISHKILPPAVDIICRNTFVLEFKYPSLQNTITPVLTPSLNVALLPCYSLLWCEN